LSRYRTQRPRHKQSGFSLLESIVALVLLASVGMALFSWINTSVMSLQRVREANLESETTLNVIEYMQTVNPLLKPDGKADLGSYGLTWKATQLGPLRDGAGYPAGIGLWQLGFYETEVNITRENQVPWFSLKLKQVGYQRIRSISLD
jgi:general secretion pathway protein I